MMVLVSAIVTLVISSVGRAGDAVKVPADSSLVTATRYVEKSDRYLHHSKLKRGMKGYGLTVMVGTKIVKFDAEIVSVITNFGMHKDVIMAKLSGLGLEKSGIIQGMSGSPVYMKDPADGKYKMIGAVAYGWPLQKEPLCGIQPITQMLAIKGVIDEKGSAKPATATRLTAASGKVSPAMSAPRKFLDMVLTADKADFSVIRAKAEAANSNTSGRLIPLSTPLMISGINSADFAQIAKKLQPLGIVPVQSGGAGKAQKKLAKNTKFKPGSAITLPLATGDVDWVAVGTVTEVIGNRVLAFGHSFEAFGDTAMPIGPGYVHTNISSIMTSFKLASSLGLDGINGTLVRDETVGVLGKVGKIPSMIPMTVRINWKKDGRKETYKYHLCKNTFFTPMMVWHLVGGSAHSFRGLPEKHTVRYKIDIDFGKPGKYHVENTTSGYSVYPVLSDAARPVFTMLRTPLGQPVHAKNINVEIDIEERNSTAQLMQFKLDGKVYRPGETITGQVTIRPFRKPRTTIPVSFKLPRNLPEGVYSLAACDWNAATNLLKAENPHHFNPKTVKALLESIQRTVSHKMDHLYLRLPLPQGGIALGQKELPDLPPSRAIILAEAKKIDTRIFRKVLVKPMKTKYVLSGSTSAMFKVKQKPQETRLRNQ